MSNSALKTYKSVKYVSYDSLNVKLDFGTLFSKFSRMLPES